MKRLRYPVSCERMDGYVRLKRAFALLNAKHADGANEHF